MVAIAGRNTVAVSVSGGESWLPTKTLDADFSIDSVAVDNSGDVWLAARTGLFRSTDAGDSWKKVSSLRLADIQTIRFDDDNHRVLVTSGLSVNIFESAIMAAHGTRSPRDGGSAIFTLPTDACWGLRLSMVWWSSLKLPPQPKMSQETERVNHRSIKETATLPMVKSPQFKNNQPTNLRN